MRARWLPASFFTLLLLGVLIACRTPLTQATESIQLQLGRSVNASATPTATPTAFIPTPTPTPTAAPPTPTPAPPTPTPVPPTPTPTPFALAGIVRNIDTPGQLIPGSQFEFQVFPSSAVSSVVFDPTLPCATTSGSIPVAYNNGTVISGVATTIVVNQTVIIFGQGFNAQNAPVPAGTCPNHVGSAANPATAITVSATPPPTPLPTAPPTPVPTPVPTATPIATPTPLLQARIAGVAVTGADATTLGVTLAGVVTGDLEIAEVAWVAETTPTAITITPPAGWTHVAGLDVDTLTGSRQFFDVLGALYTHVRAAGDANSITFTASGSTSIAIRVREIQGSNVTAPFDGNSLKSGTQTAFPYGVTTTTFNDVNANDLLLGYFVTNGSKGTLSAISGMTADARQTTTSATIPFDLFGVHSVPNQAGLVAPSIAYTVAAQAAGGTYFGAVGTAARTYAVAAPGGLPSPTPSPVPTPTPGVGGTPVLVQSAFGTFQNGTGNFSTPVTLTTTPVAGNVLIGFIFAQSSSPAPVVSGPPGWTAIPGTFQSDDPNGQAAQAFYHIVQAGDGRVWTFSSTITGGQDVNAMVEEFSGENTSTPVAAGVSSDIAGAAVTTMTAPTGSSPANGSLPVALFGIDSTALATSFTPTWTQDVNNVQGNILLHAQHGPLLANAGTFSPSVSFASGTSNAILTAFVVVAANATITGGGGGTNGAYTYAGCPIFPGTSTGNSGGWYDTDVFNATPAQSITYSGDGTVISPNASSRLMSNFVTTSGNSGINVRGGTYPTIQEVINTPSSVTLFGVTTNDSPETTTLPGPWQQYGGTGAPSPGTLLGMNSSDAHYIVLQPGPCKNWQSTVFGFTAGGSPPFNAPFNSVLYNTTQPQPTGAGFAAAGDCCGTALLAMLIKPVELQTAEANGTFVHHAVGINIASNEGGPEPTDEQGWVPPATVAQGFGAANGIGPCPTAPICIAYGMHFRLHASFNDAGFSKGAKAVAETLKHFGAYLSDTGCCTTLLGLAQDWSGIDMNTLWTSTDESFINTIHISDFDIIAPADSNSPS